MRVIVLGKPGCGLCDAAKKNLLERLHIKFTFVDVSSAMAWHEGWRDDGSEEIRAILELHDGHLPVILIDGRDYGYAAAMAELKKQVHAEAQSSQRLLSDVDPQSSASSADSACGK